MHTDHEVLEALRSQFGTGELAGTLGRLLRVPEAWAALHNPAYLEAVTSSQPPAHLTPSHLAGLALGGELGGRIHMALAEPHQQRTGGLWQEFELGSERKRDLFETALLGLEFVLRYVDDPELIGQPLERPQSWQSPLSVVWPALPDPENFLAELMTAGAHPLAIQIALANLPADEAASYLTRNANGSTIPMLVEMTRSGGRELSKSLAEPKIMHASHANGLPSTLIEAAGLQASGSLEQARELLDRAWGDASSLTAHIADVTADLAREADDAVAEIDANRRALKLAPTPKRRARTAMSLARHERVDEALSLLADSESTLEEQIAASSIQVTIENSEQAGLRLSQTLAEAKRSTNLEHAWFELLERSFRSVGDIESAIQVGTRRIESFPASSKARLQLAHTLSDAGDWEAALPQAEIAQALDPDSDAAQELFADALEATEQFEKALEQRMALANADPISLADCAMRAGKLDDAGELVEQMLIEDPRSVDAHVVLGQILAAKDENGAARAAFAEAINLGPPDASAHRALAAFQDKVGERRSAGHTLRAASQAYPADAAAQMDLARWLRTEKRISEAVQAAAEAVALDPANVHYAIERAEQLVELGHFDQALTELRAVARRLPRSWRVRLALAKSFEQVGDLDQAFKYLDRLPESSSAAEQLAAGRIGVKAGKDLESAARALQRAEQLGHSDSSLDLWYGQALEKLGRFDESFERYARVLNQGSTVPNDRRQRAMLGTARAALGQEQISLALSTLEEASEEFGKTARILALTSQVYRSAKLLDKALETAEDAVQHDRSDPGAWKALAEALAGSGDFVGALSAMERMSSLDPSSVEGWLQLARLAVESGEQPTARKALAEAIWHGRREPEVLANAADTLAAAGAVESAIRLMKAAIRRQPDDPRLLEAAADLHEQAGELQPAMDAWIDCAALQADNPRPLAMAATCARKLGQSAVSVELLERGLALSPSSSGVRRELAAAYLQHGRIDLGISTLVQALKEAPNDVSLVSEAAEAALMAGAAREALGMVGKGQLLAADEGRTQAALAEGYLLLNEWEKAETALAAAVEQGELSARVLAMLAVVATDKAGLQAGRDALAQAEAVPVQSVHEAIWLARAQLRVLEAGKALKTLIPWEADTFAAIEAVRVILRSRDAAWLLSQAGVAGGVEQKLPPAASAVEGLEKRGLHTSAIAPLVAWSNAGEAPELLTEYLASDPSGQVGEALVIAHLKRGSAAHALEAVQQTLAQCPGAEWLSVLKGLGHQMAGDAERARASFSESMKGIAPLAEYLIGHSYAEAGSSKLAARHMNKAIAEWPARAAWHYELGTIYRESDEPDSALAHFQSAATTESENHEYQLGLAHAYQACGHLSQSEEAFEIALRSGIGSTRDYLAAGEAALSLERPDKALSWFEQASALDQKDPAAHIGAARAAQAVGDQRAASVHLRTALQLAPEMPEVLIGQGQILTQAGDVQGAIKAFEQALRAGADATEVHRHQSKLHLSSGDSEGAVRALKSALEQEPHDDRLWHDLALALEAHGDMAAADEAACGAIRISPMNPEYRLTLARLSRQAGNLDRAIEELRQGGQSVPKDARFRVETGLVHEDRREYSRALDSYREAIELDPDCLEAFYRAGLLLRTLKAYRRAGEMLKRAAELAPINRNILHQLAAVRALELVHG